MRGKSCDVDRALDGIAADAFSKGVVLRVSRTGRRGIDLEYLCRTFGEPGAGATVISRLCEFADAHRATIFLYAFEADPDLMAYYRRFGFDVDGRAGDEAEMRRNPQAYSSAERTHTSHIRPNEST